MSEGPILQNSSTAGNKKRKRALDAQDDQAHKRNSLNGDSGDQNQPEQIHQEEHLHQSSTFAAEDFARHLQTATQDLHEEGNGLGPEHPNLPYGTSGEDAAPNFQLNGETNHQGTPYNYSFKHAETDASTRNKPVVGSAEWHQNRKDCHKEVERRRRETINEGIMALAGIVPDCEKAKGAILQRAVSYVVELRQMIDTLQHDNAQTKSTLEGLLAQMTSEVTDLRADNTAFAAEIERLKDKVRSLGGDPENEQ